jgi:chemotaxis response regulator CheB
MMTAEMDRDIVVIGGSAGALDPLKQIVADVPVGLNREVMVRCRNRTSIRRPHAVDTRLAGHSSDFGRRVVGVVLSGGLDDGSAGLAAIEVAAPKHVLPSEGIGGVIVHEVHEAAETGGRLQRGNGRRGGAN